MARLEPLHARSDGRTPKPARIAIVGGGFSGTLVLLNMVDVATPGTFIELFEVRGEVGPGTAYGTREPVHLLNVQAGRMGALAAKPDDFFRWLKTDLGAMHCAAHWPGRDVQAIDYVPRALYAAYLRDLLANALKKASGAGIDVHITQGRVEDVSLRGHGSFLSVTSRENGQKRRSRFEALILATGNFPPRQPMALGKRSQQSQRYVGDVWYPNGESPFPSKIKELTSKSTVLVLGTGLTAVDAILTLQAHGFKGKTIAVSRNGRLPLPHSTEARREWKWVVEPDRVQPTALALLRWLRGEAAAATAAGIDWRNIFDALRPHTPTLWRKLRMDQRRGLLRRHSLWSIHRHRMAPEVFAKIEALRHNGILEVIGGRIRAVRRRFGGFRVQLRRSGAREDEVLYPSLILNCTGPECDVTAMDERLWKNLLRKKLVMPSPVRAGISITANATAAGKGNSRIFAIGSLLLGDQFECTAVPELREQAHRIAVEAAALTQML